MNKEKNVPKIVRITTVPQSLRVLLRGQLRFMSENGFEVVGVSSPGDALIDVSNNEGIRVEAISMTRTISLFEDLKSLYKLFILLKREKPQIVHTHTPKAGTLGMVAAKLAGVPLRLHTVAGLPLLEVTGNKRKLLNVVEKVTYNCATHVFPNSFVLRDVIVENKYTKAYKLKVLANGSSNGIDTEHFDPARYSDADRDKLKKDLRIDEEDFVFIFVGRLVADKGINELVSAFSLLCGVKQNVKLILVGPFENLDPLFSKTLKEIEININILAVGLQADVRPYLNIADCLVFPSYREGFPNVVMQAGAMGLPCIVTNINGCNEIIHQDENGFIIPVKDSKAIEKSMIFIMAEINLFNRMKSRSRKMIVDRYEQRLIWDALLLEYKKLLDLEEK